MYLVIIGFVLPSAVFTLCAFLAWIRTWELTRKREHKVIHRLEMEVRKRIEEHRRNMFGDVSADYSMKYSSPMIKIGKPDECEEDVPEDVLVV